MNREQKALLFVIVTLLLVTFAFLGGTYYLWRESRLPKSPVIAFESDSNERQPDAGVSTSTAYLYYFDPGQGSLVRAPVTLSLPARTGNFAERLRLAWEQMAIAPSGHGLVSPVPPGGAIDTIFIESAERMLYLSLNEEFFLNHPGGAIEGWATVYSIVNTASGLSPLVDRVMLLRQGRLTREGPGGWDYSRSFEPNETRVRAYQAEPL